MNLTDKILILGGSGMVGKSLKHLLSTNHYLNILIPSSKELDLTNKNQVETYFEKHKPDYVFHLAAKVGGIAANIKQPADFTYVNLSMALNVIHSAFLYKTKKLLYVGSSCVFPRDCRQPIKEEYLLTGTVEPTNEGYALAKIAGIKLCQSYAKQHGRNFISVMPPNIYGPNDNFNPITSHVVSGMIKRFHDSKNNNDPTITCWGDGSAMRELMYVDDIVNGLLFCMDNYHDTTTPINVGTGKDVTIKQLAHTIKDIVGYKGQIVWDTTKPSGMPRRVMDVSKINKLGWMYTTELEEGIKNTYEWYKTALCI